PVVTHWEQPAQSLDRLPQELLARVHDNVGLDSVWCEFSIGAGPLESVAATRVGSDSFMVSIGAGTARGQSIAYRYVARDRSAAGNLGYSNPGFDTLRVGYDWLDGFW